MSGRERVGKMLSGQPVDRPPFAPVLSLYGARLTGQDARRYYTDPAAYVAGQRAVLDLVAPDVVFTPFVATLEAAAFGGVEHFLERHPPNLESPPVRRARDLGRVRPPDVRTHPRLAYAREATRRLRGELGDRAMVCGIALTPVELGAMVLGLEGFLEALLFDPEGLRTVLALTEPFFVEWANALLSDGADFLALPVGFATPAVVTEQILLEAVLPVLRRAFAQLKGPVVFHHCGTSLAPFLKHLLDLPAVAGFALDSGDDLAEARRVVGPGRLLLGNVDGPSLEDATAPEVLARARAVVAGRAGDPLFMLATAAADVPWNTPPANLLALREAVEERAAVPPPSGPRVTLCSCSIFRSTIAAMAFSEGPPRSLFLDSSLHMDPADLDRVLGSIVDFEVGQGRRVVLAYGDCAPHIDDRCRPPHCVRLAVQNCCEAELGRDRYRSLRHDGAFIFLPEWAGRWREMLSRAAGDDEGMMRAMVADQNQRIVVLFEPGREPSPGDLDELRRCFGLPVSVEAVPEGRLSRALREAWAQARGG